MKIAKHYLLYVVLGVQIFFANAKNKGCVSGGCVVIGSFFLQAKIPPCGMMGQLSPVHMKHLNMCIHSDCSTSFCLAVGNVLTHIWQCGVHEETDPEKTGVLIASCIAEYSGFIV